MIRAVLFDFDGTVFDTVEGIAKSTQYALKKHGVERPAEELRCFAGPPMVDKFMEVFGVEKSEAEQLVLDFRERYLPVGVYESRPFPGIADLLARLREAGFRLAVATSKPFETAALLLHHSGLWDAFDAVEGSHPGVNNEPKRVTVLRALSSLGAEKDSAVLVGDTKYDVIGAHEAGIPCIGAGWGYAAPGELEAAGADAIVPDLPSLLRFLLNE